MSVMTDQDRREETAVSVMSVTQIDETEPTPAAEAVAVAEEAAPEAVAVAEVAASDVEAEAEKASAEAEAVAEEASSEAVAAPTPEATAEVPAAQTEEVVAEATSTTAAAVEPGTPAEGSQGGEEAGAQFTPVAEDEERPRRLKDLEAGMELEGRVTSIALYGIFVDVGVGRDGLVHISEMSDTRIETPSDLVQIGDIVKVRVKSVDLDARRISLTMRSKERPEGGRNRNRKRSEVDRDQLSSLKVGDTVEGTITGMAQFGAFADIGMGKDGLIHVSELAEGRVEKPEDAVKVGERYTFKVLEIDPDGNRISLSLRKAMRSQRMQQLEPGQVLEGTVSGLATFGAFVDIGVGRDGLVHISALSENRVEKVEDVVKVGDKVTVKVLEVDPQSKRISLTMRLNDPQPAPESDEPSEVPSQVVPRTGPGAMARFATPPARERSEEGSRRDRGDRRDDRRRGDRRDDRRNATPQPVTSESYSTADDPADEFVGDATLEDLLTKFGGPSSSSRRDKGRRRNEEEYEDEDEATSRRQRDAIKRTLQQVGKDD
jgi:small subunit ribosomal protein S1